MHIHVHVHVHGIQTNQIPIGHKRDKNKQNKTKQRNTDSRIDKTG